MIGRFEIEIEIRFSKVIHETQTPLPGRESDATETILEVAVVESRLLDAVPQEDGDREQDDNIKR